MSGVSALNHCTELWVSDAGETASGANRARANANLDDVCPRQDEFLCHFPGHNISGENGVFRVLLADASHILDKVLRVTVGNIDTDVHHPPLFNQRGNFREVALRRPRRHANVVQNVLAATFHEGIPFFEGIVLVDSGQHLELGQGLGNFECASCVHVRRHDGHPSPVPSRMLEGQSSLQRNLGATRQRAAFWPDKHILKIKLDPDFEAHPRK
mmetsp:Transcript_13310/g.30657  ORF Transcript_13310/g.30657 Transcript_13310/m.30657 type:complete len:213 (-) Transcript_13310:2-640(-)